MMKNDLVQKLVKHLYKNNPELHDWRFRPNQEFGGKTPQELINEGKERRVLTYLFHRLNT